MHIHQSAEDYLEMILMLSEKKGEVRSIDIAAGLGVSKPSVSVAMKQLRENGYILMDQSNLITLTDAGLLVALRVSVVLLVALVALVSRLLGAESRHVHRRSPFFWSVLVSLRLDRWPQDVVPPVRVRVHGLYRYLGSRLVPRLPLEAAVLAGFRPGHLAVSEVDLGMDCEVQEDVPDLESVYPDVGEWEELESGVREILCHGSRPSRHVLPTATDRVPGHVRDLVDER